MKPNLTPVKMRSPVQLQEIERKLDKIIELLQRLANRLGTSVD